MGKHAKRKLEAGAMCVVAYGPCCRFTPGNAAAQTVRYPGVQTCASTHGSSKCELQAGDAMRMHPAMARDHRVLRAPLAGHAAEAKAEEILPKCQHHEAGVERARIRPWLENLRHEAATSLPARAKAEAEIKILMLRLSRGHKYKVRTRLCK